MHPLRRKPSWQVAAEYGDERRDKEEKAREKTDHLPCPTRDDIAGGYTFIGDGGMTDRGRRPYMTETNSAAQKTNATGKK